MKSRSEPIVRRKLSDEIFVRLKQMIISGELSTGDEMPSERELMEHFGVGRPAIREAMQALSNMGLVAISHGERAKVLELTADSILQQVDTAAKIMLAKSADSLEHLKSARLFFERGMAREAAEKATAEDVALLTEILAEQKNALGDGDAFINADVRFHSTLASISANPIYEAVSRAMLGWLKEYHTELLLWTGKEKTTLAEHKRIIQCLKKNDPQAAENAMIKHLKRSNALYLKTEK